ncbi:MAG: helix-turn-helix transcriptional regulator [Actinomycetes bacterium]
MTPEALTPEKPLYEQTTITDVALRLRLTRKSHGWSLGDVERLTRGRIKAVVLGSYERSDRTLSVKRAIELATLYHVPLSHLLCAPENSPAPGEDGFRIVIDLRAVAMVKAGPIDARLNQLRTFLAWIIGQRSDWNGEILSLRKADLSNLALITFATEGEIAQWLGGKKFLITALNHP